MKKILLFIVLLLLSTAVIATGSGEAKQAWLDAKQTTADLQYEYNAARIDFAANASAENEQLVISTGKAVLNAALDEAEAWLNWKKIEAEENTEVPEDIKQGIYDDVETNLGKIDALRTDVDNVNTRLELGLTWLKMVGKYFELLTDVARNSGNVWAYIGDKRADDVERYEGLLRDTAEQMSDNEDIIAKLDMADSELQTARNNIDNAKTVYDMVRLPGTPFIKFAEGNSYLRAAQANLIGAHNYLNQAFIAIQARGG
ncbi:MAG: hypothetical protein KJ574_02890 [Nanoarchaeota archaeon]|nr:hypothetical protein [Nanoarchaeota archaeon]